MRRAYSNQDKQYETTTATTTITSTQQRIAAAKKLENSFIIDLRQISSIVERRCLIGIIFFS